ncbi:hypothetical protein LDENG_00243370, partial [Lucifuga dentata]
VSYYSTCACLSDKTKYPTFFRTIPSDYYQAKALAALVKHFGWQWIGAIQSDNDYNITGIQWIGTDSWITPPVSDGLSVTQTKTKICTGNESLMNFQHVFFNVSQLRGSYTVYKAVYAVAHALHHLVFCEPVGGKAVRPCLNISEIKPIKVTDHLHKVNFTNHFGDNVFFDEKGDPPASYDIMNWQLIDGQAMTTFFSQVPKSVCSNVCPVGTRKSQIKGKPICCFDCIPCADGAIANSTGSTDCTFCPKEYWSNENKDRCILKTIEFLSYHEPLGTTITVVSLIGASLSLATMFVFIRYKYTPATIPGSTVAGKFGPAQQRIIVGSCTLIQIMICVVWLTLNPPFPDMVFRYSNTKIVLECNTGSDVAFYAVLGYIGILAVVCLVLAFLARKLPDNFNEAKFITFSMLIFCAVWITFIPAYVSSPGKFTVAVEIFAILSSAFGLLLSIFAPKCYIILIKPEKNTRKHVMGKI